MAQLQHQLLITLIQGYACISHLKHLLLFFLMLSLALVCIELIKKQHQHLQRLKLIQQYVQLYNLVPMLMLLLQKDQILLSKLLKLLKHPNQPQPLLKLLNVQQLHVKQMPQLFCKNAKLRIFIKILFIFLTFYSANVWTNYGKILFETTASAKSSEKLASLPNASAALY